MLLRCYVSVELSEWSRVALQQLFTLTVINLSLGNNEHSIDFDLKYLNFKINHFRSFLFHFR